MTSLNGFSGSKFGFLGPKRLVDPVHHHQKTRRGRKRKEEGNGEEIEEESVKKTSRKKGEVDPVSVDEGKVNGKKKAKARMIRNVTKTTLRKKAADKMKEQG